MQPWLAEIPIYRSLIWNKMPDVIKGEYLCQFFYKTGLKMNIIYTTSTLARTLSSELFP